MKKLLLAIIVPTIVLLFVLGQYLFSYRGIYQAPPTEMPSLEDIAVTTPAAKAFSDVYEQRKGTLLLDLAHQNSTDLSQLPVLASRVLSRGYTFEYLEMGDDLEEELRFADALVIILPRTAFSEEEAGKVKEFTAKGGKLLLIGDPGRPSEINSVATEFGLIFERDYLYNIEENDGNFIFIFLSDFIENELTEDLERVALYSAGSISPPDQGIILTDENTFSSVIETKGALSPVALVGGKVLALSDLAFMIEPHNSVFDNNQFISNIADWLTKSERVYYLSDFPYFLGDAVQVTYAEASLIDIALGLKNFLTDLGKSPELGQYQATAEVPQDMVFMGLFSDAAKVGQYLEGGNISITETKIETKGIGQIDRERASILYLVESGQRQVLIILADTEDRLQTTIDGLESREFRGWLVTNRLGIRQAPATEEEIEPEVELPWPGQEQ